MPLKMRMIKQMKMLQLVRWKLMNKLVTRRLRNQLSQVSCRPTWLRMKDSKLKTHMLLLPLWKAKRRRIPVESLFSITKTKRALILIMLWLRSSVSLAYHLQLIRRSFLHCKRRSRLFKMLCKTRVRSNSLKLRSSLLKNPLRLQMILHPLTRRMKKPRNRRQLPMKMTNSPRKN